MRHAAALRRSFAHGCALLLLALPVAHAGARDPVEGTWLGSAGSPKERIQVGLDFHRDASGKLALRLTQPISNYFGAETGGEVVRDGALVLHAGLALSLTLDGGTLTGTYPGPNHPASFRRVDTLPVEPPVPELPAGPPPVWQVRLGAQVYASPVVADGIAYVGTTGGVLNAIDTREGEPEWTFSAGAPIFGAVDGDAVYFACDDGFLCRLDRASGKQAWKYDLGSSDLRRVSAIDPDDGHVLWRSDVHGWTWGTPLVDGDRLHVGVAGGTPYFVRHVASDTTLDRVSGRLLSRWPLPDTGGHQWGVAGSPARGEGVVVVATIAGSLYGFPAP